MKQPERNSGQFPSPRRDLTDGSQRNNRSETVRHFVSGIQRSASTHAVSSHVDAVWINAMSPRYFVKDRAKGFHIRPDFSRMALRRDHDEWEIKIGFNFLGEARPFPLS